MLETMKAWGRMHDPTTDAAFDYANYAVDNAPVKATTFAVMLYE